MRSVKDPLGLKVPRVDKIPCDCGLSFISHTGRSICTIMQENQCHLRLGTTKSVLAEHGWKTGHNICFDKVEILYKSTSWNLRTVRELLEISLTQDVNNKKDGSKLTTTWLPIGAGAREGGRWQQSNS